VVRVERESGTPEEFFDDSLLEVRGILGHLLHGMSLFLSNSLAGDLISTGHGAEESPQCPAPSRLTARVPS
jgi:hypothetical protein